MPVSYTAASHPVVDGASHSDNKIETLISIASDLVLRIDSIQRQIDNLQSQLARSIPPASCGSVPKWWTIWMLHCQVILLDLYAEVGLGQGEITHHG
jgi:hypothetical protein